MFIKVGARAETPYKDNSLAIVRDRFEIGFMTAYLNRQLFLLRFFDLFIDEPLNIGQDRSECLLNIGTKLIS